MNRATRTELNAAGIWDPQLRNDYAHSRGLAAEHGRTYFLATRFLPPARRPAVHALYGFARTADDIVDNPAPDVTIGMKADGLQEFSASMQHPEAADPTIRAALHAAERYDLSPSLFDAFLTSMRMDLTVEEYESFSDLQEYVYGSAAVIGLMVTPVMGTVVPVAEAEPFAADLGVAFQLTNFIRDVGEDLRLGRIYLPQESLRKFGVDRERLQRRVVDDAIRDLLSFEIARTREIYRRAEPGIEMLEPRARGCVRVAFQLYGDILTAVEDADFQVFGPRIRVSRSHRAKIAASVFGAATRSAGAARLGRGGLHRAGSSGDPARPTLTS